MKDLGDIAMQRSDYQVAQDAYERALLLYRKSGGEIGEANCILSLGDIAKSRPTKFPRRPHMSRLCNSTGGTGTF